MIWVPEDAELNDFVQPVQLAQADEDFVGNIECVITGFGTTRQGGPAVRTLREASVDIWPIGWCNEAHGGLITAQHVCAGAPGMRGGCHGDSGGPLTCMIGGVRKLVGVTSWGKPDCDPTYPTVYAGVGYFRNWIKQNSGV